MSVDSFHTSGTSPSFNRSSPPCRIALLGFGTVGSAVASRLAGVHPVDGLELTQILDRHAAAKRNACAERHGPGGRLLLTRPITWTTRFEDILASDAEIVVEAVGGIEPAAEWIRAALAAGKSVVTANKQVIAHHGPALLAFAERQGRQLRFEAAVGGAMPIVRAVGDGLSGDRLTRIVAILNGTSNAVLSRMEATGCSMAHAVAEAKSSGFAEADPSTDLDGIDARAKLAILCALGFRLQVDPGRIDTRSIADLGPAEFEHALSRGCTIRQLAFAEYDRARAALTAWVAPAIVPRPSIFARTAGPENAAVVTGEHAGDIGVFGTGAGGPATAVAVIGDLLTIARDRAAIVQAPVLSRPAIVRGLESTVGIVDFGNSAGRSHPEARWFAEAV